VSDLVLVDGARRALAEVTSFDEVKDIHARMAALLKYAKDAKDPAKINEAVEGRLVAEIRMGEMLLSLGERRGGDQSSSEGTLPSNKELGVTKKQSSRWQRLAKLSHEERTAEIEDRKEKVVAALAKERRIGPGGLKASALEKLNKAWGKAEEDERHSFMTDEDRQPYVPVVPSAPLQPEAVPPSLAVSWDKAEEEERQAFMAAKECEAYIPVDLYGSPPQSLAEVWAAADVGARREFIAAVKPETLVAVVGVEGFMWGMSVEQCDEFDQLSAKEKGEPEKPALGPGEHLGRGNVVLTRRSLAPGTVL
jgi:hypothetical protein